MLELKLFSFIKKGKPTLGVKAENVLIDIKEALYYVNDDGIPQTIMEVIKDSGRIRKLENYVNRLDYSSNQPYILNNKSIQWAPSVTYPSKIICVGLNYRKHADETNAAYPEVPVLFNKFHNTLTGHKAEIAIPKVTEKLDYEVELGVVIGGKCKYVSEEEALNYVFGYCTVNDLSARDLQMKTPQWMLGKTCDDFSPVGPYLVTSDEIHDPQNLMLKTIVNGEIRQNSNTSDMIFTVAEIVSYISQHMTLEPGDLIFTGTPEGVVLGEPEENQQYLREGDVVTVEIENLGALTNVFKEEKMDEKSSEAPRELQI